MTRCGWPSFHISARTHLSTCSSLAATFPPLSPSSSSRSHMVINIAVLEHLCALPPASELLSLLAHLQTPPTTLFLTEHYLWFSRSFHHPFRYSKGLDYCLKCLLEIKTQFLSEVKDQLSSCPQCPATRQSSVIRKSILRALKRTAR